MMEENLIIRMFVDEDFDALNNTVRWNGKARNKDETVAHHEMIATIFGRIIVEEIFMPTELQITHLVQQDMKLQIITAIMFHDFDEFITGDVLHHVKYNPHNGYQIKKMLEEFIDYKMKVLFDDEVPAEKMILDACDPNEYIKLIVKVCDWLALLFYVSKEVSLGNKRFKREWDYPVKKLKTCCSELLTFKHECEIVFGGLPLNFNVIQFLRDFDFNYILNYYE